MGPRSTREQLQLAEQVSNYGNMRLQRRVRLEYIYGRNRLHESELEVAALQGHQDRRPEVTKLLDLMMFVKTQEKAREDFPQ